MTVGPVQVILFGFDRIDQFRGQIVEELGKLRGRGLIRLIDIFLAVKDASGEVKATEMTGLTEEEAVEFGNVVSKLLGLSEVGAADASAEAIERTLAAASHSIGLDYQGIRKIVENLPPGKAFGVLMFEHTWAIPLRDAIRSAGGIPLAPGVITPETLFMVGDELIRLPLWKKPRPSRLPSLRMWCVPWPSLKSSKKPRSKRPSRLWKLPTCWKPNM